MKERYIIELSCIDEGNAWGLEYGQKVYFKENGSFVLNPFDAVFYKTRNMAAQFLNDIIDAGDFMPNIKKITLTIW